MRTADDVEVTKLAEGLYTAVMLWGPAARTVGAGVKLAMPPMPRVTVPSVPATVSEKVTVPVGMPAPGLVGTTLAVKVTVCP